MEFGKCRPVGGGAGSSLGVAISPVKSPEGKFLYFGRGSPDDYHNVWRVPVGGEPAQVAESLGPSGGWEVLEDGSYCIGRVRQDGSSTIQYKTLDTDQITTVAVTERQAGWGFTVSLDRTKVRYVQGDPESDLIQVEGFW